MLETIKKDLYRLIGDDCHKRKFQYIYLIKSPGFKYVYLLRRCQNASGKMSRLFWELLLQRQKRKTGIQIPSSTRIGEGLRILHFGTIVVNPATVIGDNVTIAQGVLIGCSEGKNSGSPNIGNNVQLGANSLILGGVHVGNDVVVAPGAFINFDVPDNSIVIGNPGKIIRRETSPVKKYIVFDVKDYGQEKY